MRLKKLGIHTDEHTGERACRECGRVYCRDCLLDGPTWFGRHLCAIDLEDGHE